MNDIQITTEIEGQDLTLTRVVFEFVSTNVKQVMIVYLTLTRVVFESLFLIVLTMKNVNLTLTRVVFE